MPSRRCCHGDTQHCRPLLSLLARVCVALGASFLFLCFAINYHGRNGFFLPCCIACKYVVVVQSLSHVQLSATPRTAARQASLSITNSRSSLKLMSVESVMPSSHLILCRPLPLLPPIFATSGFFPMSQLFTSGGQSIGASASASVLPINIRD